MTDEAGGPRPEEPHSERDRESVWDYPRPPRVEPSGELVVVELGGSVVAETRRALRVLETSHPPTYYLPREDWAEGALAPAGGSRSVGRSFCEFKGWASYLDVRGGGGAVPLSAGWTYPDPTPGYEALRDRVAVYPGRMSRCLVDGEVVRAQEGDFYGGWITTRIVGPFKGGPGTRGW